MIRKGIDGATLDWAKTNALIRSETGLSPREICDLRKACGAGIEPVTGEAYSKNNLSGENHPNYSSGKYVGQKGRAAENRKGELPRTGLIADIRKWLEDNIRLGGEFYTHDLFDEFENSHTRVSISAALGDFRKSGEVIIIEGGRGKPVCLNKLIELKLPKYWDLTKPQ